MYSDWGCIGRGCCAIVDRRKPPDIHHREETVDAAEVIALIEQALSLIELALAQLEGLVLR